MSVGRARSTKRNHQCALTSSIGVHVLAAELAAAGYDTLDEQAKALDIHRSTAWTIVKRKHKLGRLNIKTRQKTLNSPHLPPGVRAILQDN